MRYSSLSEKGRRPNNEDVVFTRFDPRYPLIAAVSDGMGGHAAGEVASRISIEALDMWTRELVDAPQNVLVDAFFNANAQVISAAESDRKLRGMGATLVAAIFYHDHFITANIGIPVCIWSQGMRSARSLSITPMCRSLSAVASSRRRKPGTIPRKT